MTDIALSICAGLVTPRACWFGAFVSRICNGSNGTLLSFDVAVMRQNCSGQLAFAFP